jgi:hypothetical protein
VRLSVCNDVTVPLCKTARKPRATQQQQQGCFCFVITANVVLFFACMRSLGCDQPTGIYLVSIPCVDVDIGTDTAAICIMHKVCGLLNARPRVE